MNQSLRPTFLTVLCILTFIGSGSSIFSSFSNYQNAEVAVGVGNEALEQVMDNIEDELDSEEEANIFQKIMGSVTDGLTVENVKNIALANGISAILTLIGAILMWGLDKKGFWLYIFGTIVAIVAPIMIYEGMMGAMAGGGAAFIGILFCVLYGVNVKHLR
ncbi:hypothetical protein [uncultured Arcticibacterium sp.]|uniref:hypothetical protein n=1 Tax=uncultured Arcticibacterium sp. TaxID=2173042 RepID=UPI0030FC86B0